MIIRVNVGKHIARAERGDDGWWTIETRTNGLLARRWKMTAKEDADVFASMAVALQRLVEEGPK